MIDSDFSCNAGSEMRVLFRFYFVKKMDALICLVDGNDVDFVAAFFVPIAADF